MAERGRCAEPIASASGRADRARSGACRDHMGESGVRMRILSWALVSVLMSAATVASANGDPARMASASGQTPEQLVRGALLYKFAKFVEWPTGLGAERESVKLCVLGDPAFAELISQKVSTLSIKGHPVVARSLESPADARGCHVVYLAPGADVRAALRAIEGLAVLTVSSQTDFLAEGGMINLVRSATSISFEINLGASKRAGLELSSRLLDVALRVDSSSSSDPDAPPIPFWLGAGGPLLAAEASSAPPTRS